MEDMICDRLSIELIEYMIHFLSLHEKCPIRDTPFEFMDNSRHTHPSAQTLIPNREQLYFRSEQNQIPNATIHFLKMSQLLIEPQIEEHM
jgi:hypothetical protein